MKRQRWPMLSAAVLTVAACATTNQGAVRERLDEQSGITVTSMAEPLQFFAPQPELGLNATGFAFLGALQINRMGKRDTYLWLSVLASNGSGAPAPQPATARERFRIIADGITIEPQRLTTDGKTLGLSKSPFRRPADWAGEAYFAISPIELRGLAAASSLSLELGEENDRWRDYQPWNGDSEPLRQFVQRIVE